MSDFTEIFQNTASAIDGIQSGLDTIGTFSSIIEPLKVFNSIANGIANVLALIFTLYMIDHYAQIHPYAQVVMSIFTCASKVRLLL